MTGRVLVTGASRGIGRAIALGLARDGYEVIVNYQSNHEAAEATRRLIAEAGGTARLLPFDVVDREACARVLTEDVARAGAYYGIVCNAGVTADAAFPAMSGEAWDRVVRTTLDGFYNVVHPLLMPMVRARQGGRIVTVSSLSGLVGNRGQVNYSASKAGIIGAVKALALELASRNITVNAVVPGLIQTDMIKGVAVAEALKAIPAGRVGSPDEVASLIAYLFTDAAAYITRQAIAVNGGMS